MLQDVVFFFFCTKRVAVRVTGAVPVSFFTTGHICTCRNSAGAKGCAEARHREIASQGAPPGFIRASVGAVEQCAQAGEAPRCCRQQLSEPARSATPAEPWGRGKHRFPTFWSCWHFVFLKSMSAGTDVHAVRENWKSLALPSVNLIDPALTSVCGTFLWPPKHQRAAQAL